VQWHKPFAYQLSSGTQQEVPTKFALNQDGVVHFEVAQYDKSKPLVIDPVLVYSTYLGGSGDEFMGSIAVNSGGDIYVTGNTTSVDFPTIGGPYDSTANGSNDIVITKIKAGGASLAFSTYLGGSADETAGGIAIDGSGNVYVTGQTLSPNFPTKNAF